MPKNKYPRQMYICGAPENSRKISIQFFINISAPGSDFLRQFFQDVSSDISMQANPYSIFHFFVKEQSHVLAIFNNMFSSSCTNVRLAEENAV